MMAPRTVHLVIRGEVQGVGFRAWLQHLAQLHGLDGWVRNRRDGAVEAVLAGPADLVETTIGACRQGPSSSRVDDVEVTRGVPDIVVGSGGFEVRATI